MITFYEASSSQQSHLMLTLFLVIIAYLFYIFLSYEFDWKWNRFFNIILLAIHLIILAQLVEDFWDWQPVTTNLVRQIPVWNLWLYSFISMGIIIGELCRWKTSKKDNLGKQAVKHAMDNLPAGICVFSPSGNIALCNRVMYRLFDQLSHNEIQHLTSFTGVLEKLSDQSEVTCLSKERQTYLFPDGRVWKLSIEEITARDGLIYKQALFSDVSRFYKKTLELQSQTKELEKISKKIATLSSDALKISKEKEMLNAKTKIHDQMGQGLLALRRYLSSGDKLIEESVALSLFKNALEAIQLDQSSTPDFQEFDEILTDAQAIGVKIELFGQVPHENKLYKLTSIVLQECLTNAVRHADASKLFVEMKRNQEYFSMVVTNDGKVPDVVHRLKGGLLNLENQVAKVQGKMSVDFLPQFSLKVIVPLTREVLK